MSRTKSNIAKSRRGGYDFWSRRCFGSGGMACGPLGKRITKKKERARDRAITRLAMDDQILLQ